MTHVVSILDAIADEHLFAPWFKDRATWQSWFVFLAALFDLPMTPDQLDVYRRITFIQFVRRSRRTAGACR